MAKRLRDGCALFARLALMCTNELRSLVAAANSAPDDDTSVRVRRVRAECVDEAEHLMLNGDLPRDLFSTEIAHARKPLSDVHYAEK